MRVLPHKGRVDGRGGGVGAVAVPFQPDQVGQVAKAGRILLNIPAAGIPGDRIGQVLALAADDIGARLHRFAKARIVCILEVVVAGGIKGRVVGADGAGRVQVERGVLLDEVEGVGIGRGKLHRRLADGILPLHLAGVEVGVKQHLPIHGMGRQIAFADAAGGGVQRAVGVLRVRLQADGVAHAQRVGVVRHIVDRLLLGVQRHGVHPDRDGRSRHRHPQPLGAVGFADQGDEDIVNVAAAVHRAVEGFAAIGRFQVAGVHPPGRAVGLGFGGGGKAVLQPELHPGPDHGLQGFELHIRAERVVVQDIPAVDGVVIGDFGRAFGRAGDAVDDLVEGVPEVVGVIGRVVGVVVPHAGRRAAGRLVHRIVLRALACGILHIRRAAGMVILPGSVDRIHLGHAGGGVGVLRVPVGGRVQHKVGHGRHAGALLACHKPDGIHPGGLPFGGVRVIMVGDCLLEVAGRDKRQEAVAAVGVGIVAGADRRVGDALPPTAAAGG